MSDPRAAKPSRRGFLTGTAGLVAVASSAIAAPAADRAVADAPARSGNPARSGGTSPLVQEAFHGAHQAGIVTPIQGHSYFAAFDVVTDKPAELAATLRHWTDAAARLTAGEPARPLGDDMDLPGPDTADALGLAPARLTLTFGFGAGLFTLDGKDRLGLARHRPEAFVDLPHFVGDQLAAERTGGDISVQACADDPLVAFHAIRQLSRLSYDTVKLRWSQTGFTPNFGAKETPRNLMGFKDGTNNPSAADPVDMDKFVWVGSEGPGWMRGGSYLVTRRIRMALEHWDTMKVGFQEQTLGRHKYSGAPIGRQREFDTLDLEATDKDGNPVVAENAHVRLAAPSNNDGAKILRRPYSYNDGLNFVAERWPPWRQGMEYDAGLFFVCYQRDPRAGFIKIFERMAKFDMLNQFATHVGGGYFAIPRGVAEGEFIGQGLFEAA